MRYFGVSNFHSWRIAEVVRIADQLGIDRPVASEPLYNIADRTAEVEQLPAAAHHGLGVVPYSHLARGVLSGKYAVDAPPPADSRAGRGDKRIQQAEWRPESLKLAQAIAAHAAERGTTSIAFALAWILGNKLVSATIARAPYRGAVGQLCRSPVASARSGRRALCRWPGPTRPRIDTGLYRSRISG